MEGRAIPGGDRNRVPRIEQNRSGFCFVHGNDPRRWQGSDMDQRLAHDLRFTRGHKLGIVLLGVDLQQSKAQTFGISHFFQH
jgi:hypothetical protein